jgi:hypothetical protein
VAAATTTSTMPDALKVFYVSEFLSHFEEALELSKYGQQTELPPGGGTTADWFRYLPLAIVTSAGTEGQATSSLTAKNLEGHNITASVATWYNFVEFSELLQLTSRDTKLTRGIQLIAQNAAESVERETLKQVCEHCIWPLPANAVYSDGAINASVYQEGVACISAGSTTTAFQADPSTLTFSNSTLSNDILNGGWLCISKGRSYGVASRISDYASATGIITVQDTMPDAPMSSSNSTSDYQSFATVAIPNAPLAQDGLTVGDVMTTAVLQKAEEILWKNGAKPHPGGYFVGLIHPVIWSQLLQDTKWVTSQEYRGGGDLETGQIGRWSNIKLYRMTTAARYAVTNQTNNSFSSTAGHMYMTLVFGQDAFGTLALSGRGKPEVIIEPPSSGGVANPVHLYGTMAWKLYWAVVPLNANFCVGIMSYV